MENCVVMAVVFFFYVSVFPLRLSFLSEEIFILSHVWQTYTNWRIYLLNKMILKMLDVRMLRVCVCVCV